MSFRVSDLILAGELLRAGAVNLEISRAPKTVVMHVG